MRYAMAAILPASLLFAAGCLNLRPSKTVLVGGDRIVFYHAGEPVPPVPTYVNTNGWYSISSEEMSKLLNP